VWSKLLIPVKEGYLQWLIVFVYPVLLAAIDTLVSFFSPHGTWGSFAYTQMDGLSVIQIAGKDDRRFRFVFARSSFV